MKKEEFVFTIGYQGATALVDGQSLKKYRRLSALELAEEGLFRAAFCSALYDSDAAAMNRIREMYNEKSGSEYTTSEDLKRLFGVFEVPENIEKIKLLS